MAERVRDHVGRLRTDLRALLNRAEAASPVEAIDVMADELAAMLGADELCFLIMDLSGRAVARFGGLGANAARQLEDGAEHANGRAAAGHRLREGAAHPAARPARRW